MVAAQTTAARNTAHFKFTGKRAPFIKLLLVNLLLTIGTLGIYRFWAKTDVRRFIWSNIRFMGDPLEYTGKGSELLLGFLIILAVLFPLGLIYNAIQLLVPPNETWLHVGLEVLYYLVLLMLIQVGFYRAWRYRMSRTSWRGVRLSLSGSTFAFLKLSAGWTLITVLSLGIAYPWMLVELWRYQIDHTRLGETGFRFNGTGKKIFPIWISCLTLLALLCAIATGAFFAAHEYLNLPDYNLINWFMAFSAHSAYHNATLLALAILAITLPTGYLSFVWFKLRAIRYQVRQLRFQKAKFRSSLSISRLVVFALITLTLTIFIVAGAGALFVSAVVNLMSNPSETTGFENIGIYIRIAQFVIFTGALFLLLPLVTAIIYDFELLKQLFGTLSVTNPEALEEVVQSASDSQKTGEGLADALDIGGL